MDSNNKLKNRSPLHYFVCACAVLMILATLVLFVSLSFVFPGFDSRSEFNDLSGKDARRRLSAWPDGVRENDVQKMSYKSESSRDSYSTWYRIELPATAARTWRNHIHNGQVGWSKGLRSLNHRVEGVYRAIKGPPRQHEQTGDTPTWWRPPGVEFQATEFMVWYEDSYSGVARATYAGFDELTNTLWIYEYAAQHDLLWSPGDIPAGKILAEIQQ